MILKQSDNESDSANGQLHPSVYRLAILVHDPARYQAKFRDNGFIRTFLRTFLSRSGNVASVLIRTIKFL
jgi:hypothetical protein